MEKETAINILREVHDNALFSVRTALETLVPELKESENEKMMNQLHSWMKEFGGAEEYTEKVYQWIKGLLEKQGKQKPVDKPKFKVEKGEWYICIRTFVLRGENVVIKGQTYKSNQNGTIEGENKRLFIDTHDGKASEYFRPWCIQDAKDGDVLVDVYGNIGIFEQYDDFDWTSYYSLGVNGGFQHFKVEHENEKTYPATKEQRDLLFQKMKEAGYEWDVNEKKLKKIEQEYHCTGVREPKEATGVLKQFLNKEKYAWSEDDGKNMLYVLVKLEPHITAGDFAGIQNWLKSIKDRLNN